ncbi:uncharacterized protein LOC128681562 [Plodia interpunctella]|uniref:uncharacterized protein LOC128681562 n=1 Tax=Plodia interpunctella TaxID=58824 RepID=UPI002367CB24|nr:uncharacterized protein LOC128681562 [Plodia interpunctella]
MVKAASEGNVKAQNIQINSSIAKKKKKIKKKKVSITNTQGKAEGEAKPAAKVGECKVDLPIDDDITSRYPVLKDEQLVKRFLDVPMNNNQKGRLRLQIKDKLKGTSEVILPDVIYNRIQCILKANTNLTDTDLRKIRILYNMLISALKGENPTEPTNKKNEKIDRKRSSPLPEKTDDIRKDKKAVEKKVKGKKRYVVFLGNLPLHIDKGKILNHFSELGDQVIDVRIPKRPENSKSAIAYVELTNEPTYELALSKHHSMLGNRRINVHYTVQKNGKITKGEAKSKSAKMVALQKSGKLLGSIPANRKRSHRRMKMKQALAKQQLQENA